MKFLVLLFLLTGCASQSAMPLGNNMMQIDVSAAPVYGRSGAMQIAYKEAAKATIEAGYDKFIVVGNHGWNEQSASGTAHGSFSANNQNAFGSSSSAFQTMRNPEVNMIIRMFHNGDKGSKDAIDARSVK